MRTSKPPDRYLTINHGKLTVKVPMNLFKGTTGILDQEKTIPFKKVLKERYPWLTDNSLDVLIRKAKEEYIKTVDNESKGRLVARDLEAKGKNEEALAHLKKHLEADPNDADSWYAFGDLLCKMGRAEEGYKAYARGRELF
jgi:tetratricopeptide (TPR) repeat protein